MAEILGCSGGHHKHWPVGSQQTGAHDLPACAVLVRRGLPDDQKSARPLRSSTICCAMPATSIHSIPACLVSGNRRSNAASAEAARVVSAALSSASRSAERTSSLCAIRVFAGAHQQHIDMRGAGQYRETSRSGEQRAGGLRIIEYRQNHARHRASPGLAPRLRPHHRCGFARSTRFLLGLVLVEHGTRGGGALFRQLVAMLGAPLE
jgi:hypothetical protein